MSRFKYGDHTTEVNSSSCLMHTTEASCISCKSVNKHLQNIEKLKSTKAHIRRGLLRDLSEEEGSCSLVKVSL